MKYNVKEIFAFEKNNASLIVIDVDNLSTFSVNGEWFVLKDGLYYKYINIIQENIPLKPKDINIKVLEVDTLLDKNELDINKYKIELVNGNQ